MLHCIVQVVNLSCFFLFQPLNEVLNKVLQNYRMEMPDKCPPYVYKLMRQCWEMKAKDRPSFNILLNALHKRDRETNI